MCSCTKLTVYLVLGKAHKEALVEDEIALEIDELRIHDRCAAATKVDGRVKGHVPHEFSKVVFYFIRNGRSVTGEVCGRGRGALRI